LRIHQQREGGDTERRNKTNQKTNILINKQELAKANQKQ
jgi:hypothetical protein